MTKTVTDRLQHRGIPHVPCRPEGGKLTWWAYMACRMMDYPTRRA